MYLSVCLSQKVHLAKGGFPWSAKERLVEVHGVWCFSDNFGVSSMWIWALRDTPSLHSAKQLGGYKTLWIMGCWCFLNPALSKGSSSSAVLTSQAVHDFFHQQYQLFSRIGPRSTVAIWVNDECDSATSGFIGSTTCSLWIFLICSLSTLKWHHVMSPRMVVNWEVLAAWGAWWISFETQEHTVTFWHCFLLSGG